MTRLPILNAQQIEKALFKLGFQAVRQKGSHVFYRHSDGRTTTVPHHRGRDVARHLLYEILRETEVTPEEFVRVFQNL